MKEGATVRQKTGSPQMTYSCLSIENPSNADVYLNHRGYWEVRKDDPTSGLLRGDLVHEATNIWGNHTPQVCRCPMPADLVISRGTSKINPEQVDTIWARQWAKQSRRIQKLLAYRRLAYKAIDL